MDPFIIKKTTKTHRQLMNKPPYMTRRTTRVQLAQVAHIHPVQTNLTCQERLHNTIMHEAMDTHTNKSTNLRRQSLITV